MQTEKQGQLVKALKPKGAQSVQACSWSPQGTPLVSCDKAGALTFWAPSDGSPMSLQDSDAPGSPSHMRATR